MRKNSNDEIMAEVEYVEKSTSYTAKKFKKIDILIFVFCLALAFIFWCYALYVDDPVIQKNVTVNFVLEGGQSNEFILPTSQKIMVYGERSVLENINAVTVKVKRSDFNAYNKDTLITLEFPNNIQSYTKQVKLQLNFIPN